MFSKSNRGFTLIELLTVIAIIGILAAILIPTVGAARTAALKAKTKVQFSQWATSMNLFKQEYGYYPDIAASNKIDPTKFFAALTGRTYAGVSITTAAALNGNAKQMSFYSVAVGDLVKDGTGAVKNELKDAFGNSAIGVYVDSDGDGIVVPVAAKLDIGNSVDGTSTNAFNPNAADFPAAGIRAGVVFFSAGKGSSSNDYVLSWK